MQKEHFVKVFELIGMLLAASDSSKQGELALERLHVRPSYAVIDVEMQNKEQEEKRRKEHLKGL